MNGLGSFTDTKPFRFILELTDMVRGGLLEESLARKLADILNGKCSAKEDWNPPEPWSEDARQQAKYFSWVNKYKDDPDYQDGETQTPFENLLERY